MVFCSIPLLTVLIRTELLVGIWAQSFLFSRFSLIFYISFIVKLPVFFFHSWLPLIHVERPTTGSVILARILLKLGSIGILHIFITMCKSDMFIILGVIGRTVRSIVCFIYSDVKKIIAISSVAHLRVIILIIANITTIRIVVLIFLSVTHGVISGLIFLVYGSFSHSIQSRSIVRLREISIRKKETIFILIILMANMRLPGIISFIPEIMRIRYLISFSSVLAILLLLFLISVSYYNI